MGAAVLAGAYQNYRMSQTEKIASNLTLADLEATAIPIDKDLDPGFGGGTWGDGNGCTAFFSCGNGRIIHCDGQISCQALPYGEVVCDGMITVACY